MKKTILFAFATAAFSTSALAAIPADGNNYIYAGAGAVSLESKQSVSGATEEINPSYTLGLGREIHPHIAVEAFYNYGSTTYDFLFSNAETDVSISQLGVGLVPSTDYLGNTNLKLVGRINASFVKVKTEYKNLGYMPSDSESGVMIDAGIGLHWDINPRLMMRAEYITNIADSSLNNLGDHYDYSGAQLTLGYRF
ncbi:porin family protein [Photobacterium sp. GJ3]|uniref:porin family protein n=1 Tax=Photobacterium sp. GJ3 TaxID=2829502 RepID=UPI001B8DA27F|nr:porin family protein [Photobacterium sp. GJ3]QUJ68187.1 porin family protein [Photobacterium sp. GJ3]